MGIQVSIHSSTLAWKIPWRRSLVGCSHGVAKSRTQLSDFTFTFHFHALEKEMATHSCSCLQNARDGGTWWAAVYGVTAQSRTRLTRLSSSSSSKSPFPPPALHVLVTQSCATLCNPMDCGPLGSSVHGILQAGTLEWVAIPFSRGSSLPRNRTKFRLQADSLPSEPPES